MNNISSSSSPTVFFYFWVFSIQSYNSNFRNSLENLIACSIYIVLRMCNTWITWPHKSKKQKIKKETELSILKHMYVCITGLTINLEILLFNLKNNIHTITFKVWWLFTIISKLTLNHICLAIDFYPLLVRIRKCYLVIAEKFLYSNLFEINFMIIVNL